MIISQHYFTETLFINQYCNITNVLSLANYLTNITKVSPIYCSRNVPSPHHPTTIHLSFIRPRPSSIPPSSIHPSIIIDLSSIHSFNIYPAIIEPSFIQHLSIHNHPSIHPKCSHHLSIFHSSSIHTSKDHPSLVNSSSIHTSFIHLSQNKHQTPRETENIST